MMLDEIVNGSNVGLQGARAVSPQFQLSLHPVAHLSHTVSPFGKLGPKITRMGDLLLFLRYSKDYGEEYYSAAVLFNLE